MNIPTIVGVGGGLIMAEFCFDCVRKVFGVDKREEDYVLSDDLCFVKNVVSGKR